MSEIYHILQELDEDLLMDFLDTVYYEQGRIEHVLMNLDTEIDVKFELIKMADYIENIEGFCRQTLMDPMVQYLVTLQQLVGLVVNHKLSLSDEVRELISLILDEVVSTSEDMVHLRTIDLEHLTNNQQRVSAILSLPTDRIADAVSSLIPEFIGQVDASCGVEVTKDQQATENIIESIEIDSDLETYETLSLLLDDRLPSWNGRTKTLMGMAILLNQQLESPVDERQLKLAVLTHDLGMAFFPDAVLLKSGKFTAEEVMLIQEHPILGAYLLQTGGKSDEASVIVSQHHERNDGTGYPKGLKGDEICQGAQIMAIIDSYYSLTHTRADRLFLRSELRALAEINRRSGSQFHPNMMSDFNTVINKYYLQPENSPD